MYRAIRFFALLLVPALSRAQGTYVRDEPHSQINFSASSRLIDAQGYWDKWDAKIGFDPTAIDKTTIAIDIDAKSVNTRVQARDNHLRSPAFFAADSFPVITFRSKSVHATGAPAADLDNTKVIITGDLTIRGITKTVSVPATIVFFDKDRKAGRVKGAFTVLRKDYNVGFDPPGNPVENEVGLQFDISFKQPAK